MWPRGRSQTYFVDAGVPRSRCAPSAAAICRRRRSGDGEEPRVMVSAWSPSCIRVWRVVTLTEGVPLWAYAGALNRVKSPADRANSRARAMGKARGPCLTRRFRTGPLVHEQSVNWFPPYPRWHALFAIVSPRNNVQGACVLGVTYHPKTMPFL